MKKLPTLHILNGDATQPTFALADLPGQVLVWREILSEGPVLGTLPDDEFWEKRQQYITQTYSEPQEAYNQKVLQELEKLRGAGAFFEVVLWFDADLMCQANLLYLLQRLANDGPELISVCTPAAPQAVALLNSQQLQDLFDNRQRLQPEHLKEARQLWRLFSGPDPLKLQVYLHQLAHPLPYLADALQLHLQRFPGCQTGLSHPEYALLRLIQEGATTFALLQQRFAAELPGYGFADSQLHQILARMQPDLVQGKEPLRLSFFGERVLEGYASFTPKRRWLGGVEVNGHEGWCYNQEENLLRKKL